MTNVVTEAFIGVGEVQVCREVLFELVELVHGSVAVHQLDGSYPFRMIAVGLDERRVVHPRGS